MQVISSQEGAFKARRCSTSGAVLTNQPVKLLALKGTTQSLIVQRESVGFDPTVNSFVSGTHWFCWVRRLG